MSRRAELPFDREDAENLRPETPPPPVRSAEVLDPSSVQQQVEALQRRAELLRVATIALTLPEDWVRMGDAGYLQNKGCERVTGAWGIEFDRVHPLDFQRENLHGGHVAWAVLVSARCSRTGEARSQLGTRSTVSEFYRDRFDAAGENERVQLIYDCRKSAFTNAIGRVTRALTGMSGIPIAQLERYGLDPTRIPEAQFIKGGKGGGLTADGASEKQLWKIAALACKDRRVQNLNAPDLEHTQAMLRTCRLTGGRGGTASQVIEWLSSARTAVPMDEFLQRVGYIEPEADQPAEGSAPTPARPRAGNAA